MSIPKMGHVLNGWMSNKTIKTMTKTVVNHIPVEVPSESTVDMNIQPMPAERVARKPEEQRSWKWYTIFTKSDIGLNTDDRVYISDIAYRIQSKKNWSEAGYYEYEAIEDFQDSESSTT